MAVCVAGRKHHMIKQFEINAYVKKQLQAYLEGKNLSLKAAMDSEDTNREVAAIIHAGLPAMVQKIYSLGKMQTFFWEKKTCYTTSYSAACKRPM